MAIGAVVGSDSSVQRNSVAASQLSKLPKKHVLFWQTCMILTYVTQKFDARKILPFEFRELTTTIDM